MYGLDSHFGIQVFANTIGEAWISLLEAVVQEGNICFDEERKRRALDNVRLKAAMQSSSDKIIAEYGDKKNLETMLNLTFREPVMRDCDISPSFSPGAKSYFQRIREGRLFDFVEKRLSEIPESKKAVIVFPTYDDYKQVLCNMQDDYLPCIVSVQFRLAKYGSEYRLNTTFYFRSMDVHQKGHGNLIAIAKMTEHLAERIGQNLGIVVNTGYLDGMIVDAHVYENTLDCAKKLLQSYTVSK